MVVAEEVISARLAEELQAYRSQWVAITDERVVAAAVSPGEVMEKLRELKVSDSVLHRVPQDPTAVYVL